MDIVITQPAGDAGDSFPNTTLNPVWSLGNNLLIHEKPIISDANQSGPASLLTFLNWHSNLTKFPGTRIFISESATLFASLSCIKKSAEEPMSTSEVVNNSRKYRSIIHAAIESISYKADQESSRWLQVFREIALCWHLCEILFLDLHPPGILVSQLLLWLRWHFPENNKRAEEVLASPSPTDHPLYWSVIKSFVLKGDTENAKTFLDLYNDSPNKEYFRLLAELLRKMPIYSKGMLSHEFDIAWQSWHDECLEIHNQGFLSNFPDMDDVLAVLCGEENVINRILRSDPLVSTSRWFHLLPPIVLFKDPFLKTTQLGSLARQCFDAFNHGESIGHFDHVLLSAFNYDLMETVKYSCLFPDNWWFAAHFVDLLHQANQLASHEIEDPLRLREFLLLDYADSLMADSSLWPLSIDYYDSCRATGKVRLELSLERIPLSTETLAVKIYDIALKRNLRGLCRSVCRTMAKLWLSKDRFSAALVWAVKTEDAAVSNFIALQMMRQFVESGQDNFTDCEVICNLGSKMVICESLAFLAKFCEFEQFKKQGAKDQAADILVSLISSNVSPDFFIPILILNAKSFLTDDILHPEQVCEILTLLDDFLTQHNDIEPDDALTSKGLKHLREHESKLRLLCSTALAKGFLRQA